MTPEVSTNEQPTEHLMRDVVATKNGAPLTAERIRIRELTQQALDAFRRDLPQLMQEGKWKWVAYNGDRQVAWGQRQLPVIQECKRLGFAVSEVMIRSVEPGWCEYVVAPLPEEMP
jgi:hypothetical protein